MEHNYDERKISLVVSQSHNLQQIHQGSAVIKHAIREYGNWSLFVPTHFVYCFFTYNTLYNIDWKRSLVEGKIWNIDTRKLAEYERQNEYLNFCFEDDNFVSVFSNFFIDYILNTNEDIDINEELKKIRIDRIRFGAVKSERQIHAFQDACNNVFYKGNFNFDNIADILDFIYKIRCNIFHGGKTLTDMKDEEQDIRLKIYASIIVAMNQMVFSYLDYLNGKSLNDNYFNQVMKNLTIGIMGKQAIE